MPERVSLGDRLGNTSGTVERPLFHPQSVQRKTILIIDDDGLSSWALSLRLGKLGFNVIWAQDGAGGLEEAKVRAPDLIILDLYLPKLSGEEVCKALREGDDEKLSAIPIIMLSAKDKEADRILGRVIGANAYISKPYDFNDLLRQMQLLNLYPG